MTPRRRRTGAGSSSGSGTPGQTPDTRRPASTGTDGTDVNPDDIDTMAGRLDSTQTRVGDAAGRVERVDVGPQSMGVVGGGFTGAARTHLNNAKTMLSRVRDLIGKAREGTRNTAQRYRETEATNAQRLGNIGNETEIPRTRTGTDATTPSSATTPSGTTQAPPQTRDPGGQPPGSISDRLDGSGGDDGPPPGRTTPSGADPNRRHPQQNPPQPQVGVHSLGRFDESQLTRDPQTNRITHIDGVPVREKLHEIAQQRAKVFLDEKRNGNADLSGGQTGNCVGHVIDTRTGEIFESTNGQGNDVIPPSRVHPEINQRIADMQANGPYPEFDRNGNPIPNTSQPLPGFDLPLRHAEVKAANEALHANPDANLGDMVAETNFTRAGGLKDAPFCANCSGILHDVPSNAGRREYDPQTGQLVNRPH